MRVHRESVQKGERPLDRCPQRPPTVAARPTHPATPDPSLTFQIPGHPSAVHPRSDGHRASCPSPPHVACNFYKRNPDEHLLSSPPPRIQKPQAAPPQIGGIPRSLAAIRAIQRTPRLLNSFDSVRFRFLVWILREVLRGIDRCGRWLSL